MVEMKIRKVGNSLGVIFPKEMIAKMHIHEGDTISAIELQDGFRITPYDERFARQMRLARKIMDKERDILKALANE